MIAKSISLAVSLVLIILFLMMAIVIENTLYSHLLTILSIVLGADCIRKFSTQNTEKNE